MRISTPLPAAWSQPHARTKMTPTNLNQQQGFRRDSLHISSAGRAAGKERGGVLESLIRQRDNIQEQRRLLVEGVTEENGGLDAVKGQLKEFDGLLESIEESIRQAIFDQAQKSAEGEEESSAESAAAADKPKTREEAASEQIAALTDLSADMSKTQTLDRVQTRIEGRFSVLEQEIALDESRAPYESIESKYAERSALKAQYAQNSSIQAQLLEKIEDRFEEVSMENGVVQGDPPEDQSPDGALDYPQYAQDPPLPAEDPEKKTRFGL